jgi:hypothetical protein
MVKPLEEQFLYVRHEPILSLAEFQRLAYGLPEDAVPPALLTRWATGERVEPLELLRCLETETIGAAASSDESLEIVRLASERLKRAFPDAVT